MSAPDDLDELPRRSRTPFVVAAVLLAVAGSAAWFFLRTPPKKPEAPERTLFRSQLPAWSIARSRSEGPAELATCLETAKPWPAVAAAIEKLPDAWNDKDEMKAAVRAINEAARGAGLKYWVDPQFLRNGPIFTTYDVLGRAQWKGGPGSATVEVLHVRRLDTVNIELGVLGHAGGDQPAVLRDRMELSVMRRLRTVDDEDQRANDVDEEATRLWKKTLASLVPAAGLDEAQKRLDLRETLARDMEKRLKGGKIHVARPERLGWGDDYFDFLEPYTSTRRRGGPLLLASDLRALRRADEALDDSAGLTALVQVIELEATRVEAHEITHALDPAERDVPALLQSLVGENDVRFGHLAERELRAFIGELRDAKSPACLSVVSLGLQARGSGSTATAHFFAAHTLLATLAEVDGSRGLDVPTTVEVMQKLCALPDAELRARADKAATTLYGAPLSAQLSLSSRGGEGRGEEKPPISN